MEDKKVTKPKTTTTKSVVKPEVDLELKKQNELLQEQLKLMQEQMQQLISMKSEPIEIKEVVNTSMDRWVDIVHLSSAPAGGSSHIEIPSRTIDFYKYGEVRSIRYNEFQELVGKYRSWFDKNIIALSNKDRDIAEKEGLTVDVDVPLTRFHIESLVNMSLTELENLYNILSLEHKRFITRTWAYGYYEIGGEYKDIAKIQLLNTLSNGAMDNILKDLMGR